MHRFLLLLLCALAALSMGTGAVAHAAESSVCAEQASDKAEVHSGNEEPGKPASDQGYGHQHGCHGHHLMAIMPEKSAVSHALPSTAPFVRMAPALYAARSDPALRPPQA